jgi:urease accessory protein
VNSLEGIQRRVPSVRLLQLASQSLPTGSYAYSGGLEAIVSLGWVKDTEGYAAFLETLLEAQVGNLEIPYAIRMFDAWTNGDFPRVCRLTACLRASRESRELLEQDGQMGRAVARVLRELYSDDCPPSWAPSTFAEAMAKAAVLFQLTREELALVLAYGWLEQHVMALARLLLLGPVASQKLMHRVADRVGWTVAQGLEKPDSEIGATSPLLGIASAFHEEQYTRIFRS